MKTAGQQYDVIFSTGLATIGLLFDGATLIKVEYLNKRPGPAATASAKTAKAETAKAAASVKNKIEKYLESRPTTKAIKVDMRLDVTPFQRKVLEQLQQIPYGETRSYGEIARILKTSPRAVGNACRRNPLPIIIPCHRVTAANGIGGYDGARSGSLVNIKRKLLESEGLSF